MKGGMGARTTAGAGGGAGGAHGAGGDRRVFLGWERGEGDPSLLERAARWIVHDFVDDRAAGARPVGAHGPDGLPHTGDAADLGDVLAALPGRRAARHLRERLAETAAARDRIEPGFLRRWQPPRLITAGRLADELVDLPRPTAGRLVRTLAWARALQTADARVLTQLVRDRPEGGDFGAWLGLAAMLRDLHGRLAPEGLDFGAVARAVAEGGFGAREEARWMALDDVQQRYRAELAVLGREGLDDPHEARQRALAEGASVRAAGVLLVGVLELGALARSAFCTDAVDGTALVFAPDGAADLFTPLGEVDAAAWVDAPLPLDDARWHLADRPADQAALAVQLLAEQGRGRRLDEVSLGVPDGEVVPHLERRLTLAGVPTRLAAGTPLTSTPSARLLQAAADWLQTRAFADFAALLRHPDVEAYVRTVAGEGPAPDPAMLCDEYAVEHLPGRVDGRWLGPPARRQAMQRLHEALQGLLGELNSDARRPLREWVPAIGTLLGAPHDQDLDTEDEADRTAVATLSAFADVLRTLEELPGQFDATLRVSAAEALQLVLREAGGDSVAPPAEEGAVELLGWLELLLDEAPLLILTGFNAGAVPERVVSDGFLSESFSRRLGLPGEAERSARDACALTIMLHSRADVVLITGRRSEAGEPRTPSRLLFHAGGESAARRMAAFVEAGRVPRHAPPVQDPEPDWVLPVKPGVRPGEARVESMKVTAFKDWLQSPYTYYLRHMGGRTESVDDRDTELTPLQFGNLAHQVLEGLHGHAAGASNDPEEVARFLEAELARCVTARFGSRPLPAVVLQREQLRRRLKRFAEWQAGEAAAGWQILEVEWSPEGRGWAELGRDPPEGAGRSVPFDVDGEPLALRGTIDRIDIQPSTGRWRVIDYKTGEKGDSPKETHGPNRDGVWHDLQLPLYAVLAGELRPRLEGLGIRGAPELGYVTLPRKLDELGWSVAPWSTDDLITAQDTAREIVRALRRGEWFGLASRPPRDEALAEVQGAGLLARCVAPDA